jgi:ubiquitin C-terminal hydrolase
MLLPEILEGDSAYACTACAAKVPATRQLQIVEPPATLIVTLNRFRYDRTAKAQVKVGQ